MKLYWMWAVLLCAGLVVGCGDRDANTGNSEETAPATTAPANGEPVAEAPLGGNAPSQVDGSAVRDRQAQEPATGARPTTGSRTATSVRPAAPERSAAPAEPSRPAASAAPAARAPQFREVTVPAGTALPLELMTAVSSETAKVETPVRARLRQAVVIDGYTALPAGTVLSGHVTEVERAGRVRGRSRLAFRFTEAEIAGANEDVRTNPITYEGEASKGEDATKIGGGAVGGAIVGGILGGADGAAKGAAIGGAAGTGVVLATRGREVELTSGASIAATLAEPFTIRARIN
jgi:hypothetical protein